MRSDIVPGATFPDYELPDHANVPRRLSELQGDDPLVLTLARGHYCPKEHQQHLELAAFYPRIAVAYTQVATIATDEHHTLQEFRASVGAQWTFLSDPGRIVQQDLDIQEYTDPEHDPMIPHTLVLKPGLVVHSIYNGYWFWGRPSVVDLWHDLRAVSQRDPSRLGSQHAWPAGVLGAGRLRVVPRLEPAGRRRIRLGHGASSDAGVVVDPNRREDTVVARDEDGEPASQPQRRSRRHDVVLQAHTPPVVDERTGLEQDTHAVGEHPLVVGTQAGRTAVGLPAGRRLAHGAVGLEGRDDRIDVARVERTDVRRHGLGLVQPGVGLEQGGRPVCGPAGDRP